MRPIVTVRQIRQVYDKFEHLLVGGKAMLRVIDGSRQPPSFGFLDISNTRVNELCGWRVKLAIDSR